jgi:peptide/nickel transport system ATP-binding protein
VSAGPDIVLAANDLSRAFDVSRPWPVRLLTGEGRRIVHALDGVSFEIRRGTTLAVVGESGCGKTTLAKVLAGLLRPSTGSVAFKGVDVAGFRTRRAALPYRRHLQMVFQDPQASLNPRWRVARSIAEPLRTHRVLPDREAVRRRVGELLEAVGLSAADGASTRTSSRAASVSASRSRGRLQASPTSSSATSRPPRSTSRCRRRS